jgi:hypothetical protein
MSLTPAAAAAAVLLAPVQLQLQASHAAHLLLLLALQPLLLLLPHGIQTPRDLPAGCPLLLLLLPLLLLLLQHLDQAQTSAVLLQCLAQRLTLRAAAAAAAAGPHTSCMCAAQHLQGMHSAVCCLATQHEQHVLHNGCLHCSRQLQHQNNTALAVQVKLLHVRCCCCWSSLLRVMLAAEAIARQLLQLLLPLL